MTTLDSILKSREITWPTKVRLVKAMVFSVVMYGWKGWTVKKAEPQRIDAFELWCWRRLLWVPWIARRFNQSILKETSPGVQWKDWCWGWNSNTLTISCKDLAHWKRPWCWEGLRIGGEGDDRGWDGWMASPTRCTWGWVNSGSWWWSGRPCLLRFMGWQRVTTEWLNWTELNCVNFHKFQGRGFHSYINWNYSYVTSNTLMLIIIYLCIFLFQIGIVCLIFQVSEFCVMLSAFCSNTLGSTEIQQFLWTVTQWISERGYTGLRWKSESFLKSSLNFFVLWLLDQWFIY